MRDPMRPTNTAADFFLLDNQSDLEFILEDLGEYFDALDPREMRETFSGRDRRNWD